MSSVALCPGGIFLSHSLKQCGPSASSEAFVRGLDWKSTYYIAGVGGLSVFVLLSLVNIKETALA